MSWSISRCCRSRPRRRWSKFRRRRPGTSRRLLAQPGERVKVGAPLLEFEEGPHAETGTVVGELARSRHPQRQRRRQPTASRQRPPARSPAPAPGGAGARPRARCRPCARAGRAVRTARSRWPTSKPRPPALAAGAGAKPCAARGGPWRSTWRGPGARSCTRPCTTKPTSTAGRAAEDVTVRLIRAIVAGCKAEPALNASFDAGIAVAARATPRIDLGLAIDSPDGLFVPVLRDVARVDARRIGAARSTRSSRASASAAWRPRAARRDHHAVEFRHDRRTACRAHRHAAAGRHPRRRPDRERPVRPASGHRPASHAAAVADLRSSRRHRRRGGALPARGHRRSRSARREPEESQWKTCFDLPTSSARPGSSIFTGPASA